MNDENIYSYIKSSLEAMAEPDFEDVLKRIQNDEPEEDELAAHAMAAPGKRSAHMLRVLISAAVVVLVLGLGAGGMVLLNAFGPEYNNMGYKAPDYADESAEIDEETCNIYDYEGGGATAYDNSSEVTNTAKCEKDNISDSDVSDSDADSKNESDTVSGKKEKRPSSSCYAGSSEGGVE